jgi:hypothetical protein
MFQDQNFRNYILYIKVFVVRAPINTTVNYAASDILPILCPCTIYSGFKRSFCGAIRAHFVEEKILDLPPLIQVFKSILDFKWLMYSEKLRKLYL